MGYRQEVEEASQSNSLTKQQMPLWKRVLLLLIDWVASGVTIKVNDEVVGYMASFHERNFPVIYYVPPANGEPGGYENDESPHRHPAKAQGS